MTQKLEIPVLIRTASGLGVFGLAMIAAGILELLGVLHRGPVTAILCFVTGLAFLGISAYFTWAHFYVKQHPGAAKKPKRPLRPLD